MPFQPLSGYADPTRSQTWVYCSDEQACGHRVKLDIQAAIGCHGDVPLDEFKNRLRCSKCGGRARMIARFE